MKSAQVVALLFAALIATTGADQDFSRKLLQKVYQGTPATITAKSGTSVVNAIVITPIIPYPQNAYFCNVTGDSGIPQQGPLPLTVRVPVGSTVTVVFANITGPIPGSTCNMASPSVVQQGGSSVVQQQAVSTSVQQMVNNPSSVVQQTSGGASVVQQQYATSINQQKAGMPLMSCVSGSSSVVQQNSPPSSVVQQKSPSPPTTVVQQSTPATVVQQTTPTSVVQQKSPSPPTTVVQQSTPATVVQQTTPTSVVQQSTPATVVQQSTPTSVVQQKTPTVVQQSTPSAVVQQSGRHLLEAGRHLLQAGTIEYISNNGSTGQPQLQVLDTTEGVPNISFKPTAAGQTAQFNGGLQVAVTTTNNGFGTPYIPYRVDPKLSPQCNVQINFVSF